MQVEGLDQFEFLADALAEADARIESDPLPLHTRRQAHRGALEQELADLHGKTLQSIRGWSPSEVFNHCAQSIDYSIDGYPELKPTWFRHSLGPAAFAVFSARGAMRHPLDEAIPGAAALTEPADQALALQRLQMAFQRFAEHQGALQPHFAYGALDKPDYTRAHLMHLANHAERVRQA